MSRFFDLLQRLNQQKGYSSSASVGTASESTEVASELDRALSVLLPQDAGYPKQVENGSGSRQMMSMLLPQNAVGPGELEPVFEFERIPVEEVEVRPESRIIFHTDPNSPGADRFRLLRMRLRVLWNARKLKTLLITSPRPGDGKSTIALNLATALAERGKKKVLLIEADLHRSPLTQHLNLRGAPGLAGCLEDGLSPLSVVRRLEPLGWYLLTAGQPCGNPTELVQGDGLAVVMQRLSPYFDWILIDSPPVTPLTDAISLGRQANASLLVTRAGRTPSEALERAIARLGRENIVGLVLNGAEESKELYSGYYGYSGNNYRERPEITKPNDSNGNG
jgi:capsular exopolysaccharide synthesis family protein